MSLLWFKRGSTIVKHTEQKATLRWPRMVKGKQSTPLLFEEHLGTPQVPASAAGVTAREHSAPLASPPASSGLIWGLASLDCACFVSKSVARRQRAACPSPSGLPVLRGAQSRQAELQEAQLDGRDCALAQLLLCRLHVKGQDRAASSPRQEQHLLGKRRPPGAAQRRAALGS